MSALNIFCIIRQVNTRIEPYCSKFLAKALDKSRLGDRSLIEQTWTLSSPPDWKPPTKARIVAEEILEGNRRIDIAIFDEVLSRVLGIEVKTTDESVEPGQLERYYRLLQEKYPSKDVTVVFLTPFNEGSVIEVGRDSSDAFLLPSVREYHEMCRSIHPDPATHVSWRQIANIDWAGDPLWQQFVWFVQRQIASHDILEEYLRNDLSLARFFSDGAVEKFKIVMRGLTRNDGSVRLETLARDPGALQSFLKALTTLIEDEQRVDRRKSRQDRFVADRIAKLINSEYGRVHGEIFKLSSEYCHVWIEGKNDYGLRVAHNNHPRGVSILTSSAKDNLFKMKST